MPLKDIVTEQKVTKEKLQRAKELRRDMTPAEKVLWEEFSPTGTFGVRKSWESTSEDNRLLQGLLLTSTVTP